MPNWCSSNVRIEFNSRGDVQRFLDLFGQWKRDAMENGFGEGWLGNVALNSGVGFWKDEGCVDAEGRMPLAPVALSRSILLYSMR